MYIHCQGLPSGCLLRNAGGRPSVDLLSRVKVQTVHDYQISFMEGEVLHPSGAEVLDPDIGEEVRPRD